MALTTDNSKRLTLRVRCDSWCRDHRVRDHANEGERPEKWTKYTEPIRIDNPTTRIAYRATDAAGNVSAVQEHHAASQRAKTTLGIAVDRYFVKRNGDVTLTVKVKATDGPTPTGKAELTANGRSAASQDVTAGGGGVLTFTVPAQHRGLNVLKATFTGPGYRASTACTAVGVI